jgi:hypothetical protein
MRRDVHTLRFRRRAKRRAKPFTSLATHDKYLPRLRVAIRRTALRELERVTDHVTRHGTVADKSAYGPPGGEQRLERIQWVC